MTIDCTPSNTDSATAKWQRLFSDMPLVAILRGVKPDEVLDVSTVLIEAGIRLIEVPLNSPQAFDSIELLAKNISGQACIGAGTVLNAESVHTTVRKGGEIVIAPNFDVAVAKAAVDRHTVYCPGIATPSEAFAAIAAGATALKLFPGEMISPDVVKALRAVLPADLNLLPVGGITPDAMEDYLKAGANGFGIGSALYKPQRPLVEIEKLAKEFVAAYQRFCE